MLILSIPYIVHTHIFFYTMDDDVIDSWKSAFFELPFYEDFSVTAYQNYEA